VGWVLSDLGIVFLWKCDVLYTESKFFFQVLSRGGLCMSMPVHSA
jgi:hypothetical protein